MDDDSNIVKLDAGSVDAVVGRNVRLRRLRASQSQEAVSHALDLDLESYRRSEAGVRRFNAFELMTLCTVLKTNPSELLHGVMLGADYGPDVERPVDPVTLSRRYLHDVADSIPDDEAISLAFLCRRMFDAGTSEDT